MVSQDPKLPKPTNAPPSFTAPAEPIAPRPPSEIPIWISEVIPKLDLVIEDILCPGATQFLTSVQPAKLLQDAVVEVLKELYDSRTIPSHVKNVRLVVKEMDGIAATSGNRTHKTIVFNAKYIEKLGMRAREEILGVIRHEVVHCFQYDAQGTAPGGLIEGIADFVRLRGGLAPPHWKRDQKGEHWDAGYERTGFFLDWLERTQGGGTVKRINLALCDVEYRKETFWKSLFGEQVEDLWKQYCSD
ncbi:peptidase [Ceratobasidium sp. AG-Ba]|nr:peptidase [Ceratobasidium sp. AG-Ba]